MSKLKLGVVAEFLPPAACLDCTSTLRSPIPYGDAASLSVCARKPKEPREAASRLLVPLQSAPIEPFSCCAVGKSFDCLRPTLDLTISEAGSPRGCDLPLVSGVAAFSIAGFLPSSARGESDRV